MISIYTVVVLLFITQFLKYKMENAITGWKRYMLVQPSMMILITAQAISSNFDIFYISYEC